MFTDAHEAADIGIHRTDLVAGCTLEGRNLTQFLSVAAVDRLNRSTSEPPVT
jgi:hypothetical protein